MAAPPAARDAGAAPSPLDLGPERVNELRRVYDEARAAYCTGEDGTPGSIDASHRAGIQAIAGSLAADRAPPAPRPEPSPVAPAGVEAMAVPADIEAEIAALEQAGNASGKRLRAAVLAREESAFKLGYFYGAACYIGDDSHEQMAEAQDYSWNAHREQVGGPTIPIDADERIPEPAKADPAPAALAGALARIAALRHSGRIESETEAGRAQQSQRLCWEAVEIAEAALAEGAAGDGLRPATEQEIATARHMCAYAARSQARGAGTALSEADIARMVDVFWPSFAPPGTREKARWHQDHPRRPAPPSAEGR